MKNLDVPNAAVSVIVKAALVAARWSGRAKRRSLERLAAANADAKNKELRFLRDKVFQLETQLSLLLNRASKRNRRYTVRDKLLVLATMETFQIPRRRVTESFGIARSTLYRWLHKIEERSGRYRSLFSTSDGGQASRRTEFRLHPRRARAALPPG